MDRDREKKLNYPTSVFFIILTQFCDRLCYYGMKTVLTLYLRKDLNFDESQSTVFYHLFVTLCYVSTIVGAIVADTYLGKYRTAVYFSIFYACGSSVLSVAAIPNILPQTTFSSIALIIIAIGCGCIKPCISALGGDQFVRPQQEKQLNQFFSVSYFATKVAMLIAIFVTPIFRQSIECFGKDSCFPLAFGLPAIALVVGVALFLSGKRMYKIKKPEGNIMMDVVKCTMHAISQKFKYGKVEKRKHWMDFASDKFDEQLIADIKHVLRILLLYLPVPIYWALSDQQGSRWTFQATRMDGTVGSATIKPDQVQIISPILVLALVPVFESFIYPLFTKCGLLTPLQRMGAGGILAAVAFTFSGILELSLEQTYAVIPKMGMTRLHFINSLPCHINLSYTNNNHTKWIELNATSYLLESEMTAEPVEVTAQVDLPTCGDVGFTSTQLNATIFGASKKAYSVVIFNNDGKLDLKRMEEEEPLEKDASGLTRLTFIVNTNAGTIGKVRISGGGGMFDFPFAPIQDYSKLGQTAVQTVDSGTYDVSIFAENNLTGTGSFAGNLEVKPGGCYTVLVQHDDDSKTLNATSYLLPMEVTKPNSVHMLWQIPQRFVVAVAEVMFSVSGYQFSFTQAPPRMKCVMQALWLLTIAFGNTIIIAVAKLRLIERQSIEFFLFAGLMILDMLVFFYLAYRYTYIAVDSNGEANSDQTEEDTNAVPGTQNEGFENKDDI